MRSETGRWGGRLTHTLTTTQKILAHSTTEFHQALCYSSPALGLHLQKSSSNVKMKPQKAIPQTLQQICLKIRNSVIKININRRELNPTNINDWASLCGKTSNHNQIRPGQKEHVHFSKYHRCFTTELISWPSVSKVHPDIPGSGHPRLNFS